MIVILGSTGQLGNALFEILDGAGIEYRQFSRQSLDLTNKQQLEDHLRALPKIDAIINATAYTKVDQAEVAFETCYAVNAIAVRDLGQLAFELDAHLIHISTDYVFSGNQNTPYHPSAKYNPVNNYGVSKMLGEKFLREQFADAASIVRTSWVYSHFGNNFVKTMLRLMREKPQLTVVCDQIGSPTNADTLAKVCLSLAKRKVAGVYHACDLGIASWYDFACVIQSLGLEHTLLNTQIPITPVKSDAFKTKAERPKYSVLDTSETLDLLDDIQFSHWRAPLENTIKRLKKDGF